MKNARVTYIMNELDELLFENQIGDEFLEKCEVDESLEEFFSRNQLSECDDLKELILNCAKEFWYSEDAPYSSGTRGSHRSSYKKYKKEIKEFLRTVE